MIRTVSLDVVDRVGVASPCSADWERMAGDDRVRFCSQCRLHVYNLSAMTRDEAAHLIQTTQGRLCARFYRRADGTVLTRDCPVGLRAARARAARALARLATAAACILGSGVALASGRSSGARLRALEPFATIARWLSPAQPPQPFLVGKVAIMGDVAIAPTVPPRAPHSKP
jgi:hypothetical protein